MKVFMSSRKPSRKRANRMDSEAFESQEQSKRRSTTEKLEESKTISISNSTGFERDRKGGNTEESFESVLTQFASINLNKNEENSKQRCFLCGMEILLKDFAQHIHGCVDKLRQQEEAAELATLAAAGVKVCHSGCSRRDYMHFMAEYHPPASCPACGEDMPLYEVDAHLNLCLESTAPTTTPAYMDDSQHQLAKGLVAVEVNGNQYTIDLNELTQANNLSGVKRQIMRTTEGVWKWKDDTGLFVPFDPLSTRLIERGMQRMTSKEPPPVETSTMSEERADEKEEKPAGAIEDSGTNSSGLGATGSPAGGLVAALDRKLLKSSLVEKKIADAPKLTKTQMAACAALIVKEKQKPDIEKSVSLSRLMQSFKTLGITKENLKKEL
eukprot:CAMPEP_0167797930 /NCGR_PEP_ID=MMETSP0111_2-20121227/15973_1 /TAXON_ID=91324 /ORGANISM="Lotharella globosa, Strain CCCM811" /LENGTH=382 /DNA_ID=CAMNT_0007692181 /DNA_START=60 /DNA_END=1208 /DNA_ORIENTATION=-